VLRRYISTFHHHVCVIKSRNIFCRSHHPIIAEKENIYILYTTVVDERIAERVNAKYMSLNYDDGEGMNKNVHITYLEIPRDW
jgi:hypothetical protein